MASSACGIDGCASRRIPPGLRELKDTKPEPSASSLQGQLRPSEQTLDDKIRGSSCIPGSRTSPRPPTYRLVPPSATYLDHIPSNCINESTAS